MSDLVLLIAGIATWLYADRTSETLDRKPMRDRGIGELIWALVLYLWAFALYATAVTHALGWWS